MRRLLLVVAVVFATSGILAYTLFAPFPPSERWFAVGWLAWAPIGALILWKRPGNGVAIAQLWIGVSWGITCWSALLASSGAPLRLRVWADLIGVLFGLLPWFGIVWLMVVFPTGRLEGRLEKSAAVLLALVAALALFGFTVTVEPMEGGTGQASPLASPALEGAVSWLVSSAGFVLVLLLVSLAVLSLARRWVKSTGMARHQYRWLSLGGLVFVITLTVGQIAPEDSNGLVLWIVGGFAIPTVVGVAVTRYRLYEIDRIISRTVTYGLVVALLAGVVAGLAAIVGAQFQEPWWWRRPPWGWRPCSTLCESGFRRGWTVVSTGRAMPPSG